MTSRATALVLVGAISAKVAAQQPATTAASLVFEGVTLVDVEQGKLVPDQRVVITGTRIRAVGAAGAAKLLKGARAINARGKYLIPGLWDLHTHTMRDVDLFYPLFLANGVTGIRDAGSPVPLDSLVQWRREVLVGMRLGPPRQILAGPSISANWTGQRCDRTKLQRENNPQTCIADPPVTAKDAPTARALIDSLKAAGADMIKLRELPKELYFILAAEARRLGIPFGGHVEFFLSPVSPDEASDSGATIIDHVVGGEACWTFMKGGDGIDKCQESAQRFWRNGTWFIPTLMWEPSMGRGHASSLAVLARLDSRRRAFLSGTAFPLNWLRDSLDIIADSIHKQGTEQEPFGHPINMARAELAGLPILAGTDVGPFYKNALPGFALHAELKLFAIEGMTPAAALRATTLNPAKMLHATDSMGTVAVGKLADLVLLDANPLEDITNTTTIRAVVANGRYFDRAALDQILAEVRTKTKMEP